MTNSASNADDCCSRQFVTRDRAPRRPRRQKRQTQRIRSEPHSSLCFLACVDPNKCRNVIIVHPSLVSIRIRVRLSLVCLPSFLPSSQATRRSSETEPITNKNTFILSLLFVHFARPSARGPLHLAVWANVEAKWNRKSRLWSSSFHWNDRPTTGSACLTKSWPNRFPRSYFITVNKHWSNGHAHKRQMKSTSFKCHSFSIFSFENKDTKDEQMWAKCLVSLWLLQLTLNFPEHFRFRQCLTGCFVVRHQLVPKLSFQLVRLFNYFHIEPFRHTSAILLGVGFLEFEFITSGLLKRTHWTKKEIKK